MAKLTKAQIKARREYQRQWRLKRKAKMAKETRHHATIHNQPKELLSQSPRKLAREEVNSLARRGAAAKLVELSQEIEKLQAFLGVE